MTLNTCPFVVDLAYVRSSQKKVEGGRFNHTNKLEHIREKIEFAYCIWSLLVDKREEGGTK